MRSPPDAASRSPAVSGGSHEAPHRRRRAGARRRRVRRVRPRCLPDARGFACRARAGDRRAGRIAGARRGCVLPGLRGGDRAVPAGRSRDDACSRRVLRLHDRARARVVRLEHRCHARVPRRTLPAPRHRAGETRVEAARRRRGDGQGRRLLSVHAATRADLSVLRRQPADGSDADPHLDVLLGQSARHARRHRRVRERRHPAGRARGTGGDPVTGVAGLVRAARRVPAGSALAGRRGPPTSCLRALAPAGPLRPQHGRHRRRRGRARRLVHRRRGEGEGHARGVPPHGRRLPELRLRAEQGADQECPARARDPPRRRLRPAERRPGRRFPARDGARARRDPPGRAARQRGALYVARRGRGAGARQDRGPVDRRDRRRRRYDTPHHDAQHRDRGGCAAVRAAAAGHRGSRVRHQRHALGSVRDAAGRAAAPRGSRRRADRLRTGPGVRTPPKSCRSSEPSGS